MLHHSLETKKSYSSECEERNGRGITETAVWVGNIGNPKRNVHTWFLCENNEYESFDLMASLTEESIRLKSLF